ncbi:hypothetical protein E2562_033490 [Oryza meyeriana var. granulata]|uniref:DUF834 domain-containing protein n=1 Tax=Oryza meyeriana var. granulata TaxID=110450 RepID=A0A6G1F174_9ORYZ|nr:hypothetical protein E2562_033490 [Oryza meyeriana var. granulata]
MLAQWPGRVMTMVTVDGGARETVRPGTGNSGRRHRGGDDDGGTDDVMATWGKTTRQRRRPISEVATTAINRDAAERPRWEEGDVADGNTGLTGSTRLWGRQRQLVGRDDSPTTTRATTGDEVTRS